MGLIRDVEQLKPEIREKAKKLLYLCNREGIRVMVSETLRTPEVQKAYFAQGRKPLAEVNRLRKEAGLWEIGEAEASQKVTWIRTSKHIDGLAIDVVPLKPDGKPDWNASWAVWEAIGRLGEEAGLNWGGRWKGHTDCPHFEV